MEKKNLLKIGVLVVLGILLLVSISATLTAQSWGYDITDNDSVRIIIDDDTTASDEVFAVWHDQLGMDAEELFRIQEDGKVGIGTTGPDKKLDVLDDSNPQLRLTRVDENAYVDLEADNEGDLIITPSSNKVQIKALSSTPSELEIEGPTGNYDAQVTLDVGPNSWHIGVDDSVTTPYDDPLMIGLGSTVGSNNIMTLEKYGNVGIGTTGPDTPLHVLKDDAGVNVDLITFDRTTDSPADDDSYDIIFNHENDADEQEDYAQITLIAQDVSNGWEGGALAFSVADGYDGSMDEAMRIIAGGNVGIGATSPDNPLELLSSTTPQFRITNTDATDYATFSVDTDGQLDITTVDGGGTGGHINLKPDGYVGIGVDAPQEILHIHDSAVAIRLTNPTTGYGASDGFEIGLSESASAAYIRNRENSNIAIQTQSTTRILITGTGLVGIGNAITSSAILEVADSSDNLGLVKFKATSTTQDSDIVWIGCPKLKNNGDVYNLLKIDHSTSYSENALTVRGDGRTGIGTSVPKATLDVDGGFGTQIYQPSSYTYTIDSGTKDDYTIICDTGTSGGDKQVDLPDANDCVGRILVIKKIDGTEDGNQDLIIHPASGDNIDGSGSDITITNNGDSYMLQSYDSDNWYILASN